MTKEMRQLIISLVAGNRGQIALLERQAKDLEALLGIAHKDIVLETDWVEGD